MAAVVPGSATVRPYSPDDHSAVVAMLVDRDPWKRLGYTPKSWERLLTPPLDRREAWVIECDRIPAGIAVVRLGFLRGDYLELFAIAPGQEGRGLGRRLLRAVEESVFSRGPNLFVCVSDFNHSGRRFYARNGYQQVGTIADLLIAGSSELLLRKTGHGPV